MSAKDDNGRNRVNGQIVAPRVMLIDKDGKKIGEVPTRQAMQAAEDENLDLVEIASNSTPPVAKIMDYGKYLFDKKKSRTKKKPKQIKVKEVKFRPGTDVGDYEVKLRNLRGFLEGGDKAKITVRFKGREMAHQDLGVKLLERVKADLADVAKVEFFPSLEGRDLIMVMAPKK